jgi:citrate synthase
MSEKAQLHLNGKVYELPTVTGSEGEKAVDISTLRDLTGYITLDDGYGNTGSCSSAITFIDGEKGILRYRGIPIEELAVKSTFVETAYLLIYGKLPTHPEKARFSDLLTENENLHEGMKHHFEGFPPSSHPMAMLSAMINASSCFYPGLKFRGAGGAAALAGADDRGVFVPEIARAALSLSEARLQVHGEFSLHDVLGPLREL